MVGNDVTEAILIYLNSGTLPSALCHSFITLIPKVKNPKYVSQYHPISLNNVLYRVFSKVLPNKLKKILPHVIFEHQSAFMMELLISDNIMVAFKNLHYIRNHSTGNIGYMALELDMSKTYDSMEWEHMENLIKKIKRDLLIPGQN